MCPDFRAILELNDLLSAQIGSVIYPEQLHEGAVRLNIARTQRLLGGLKLRDNAK